MNKGIFISFEGPDGSGKSTQVKLFTEFCIEKGLTVRTTREPGGTPISEKIRQIILDPENKEMADTAEALLYAAARAQHVEQVIRPAVERGEIVICDRFVDSSIAYQGFARGLGDGVRIINEFAVCGMMPELTFFLNVSAEEGMKRRTAASKLDRLEQEKIDFHKKVYEGYLKLAEMYPERYVCIDAAKPIEAVAEDIRNKFEAFLKDRK